MNLTSPSQVRQYLEQVGIQPSKALGQNFLIDRNTLANILTLAELEPSDHVLEIGPGLGVLTEELLQRCRHVTAVEMDYRLHDHLKKTFGDRQNLTLIREDILQTNLPALMATGITKVVSNLPYAAGTRALVFLAGLEQNPASMTVTIQKDVADRLSAKPGTDAYGNVSVFLQTRYEVKTSKAIPGTCFYPQPRVLSAIVRCRKLGQPLDAGLARRPFENLVKTCFLGRRKQISGLLQRSHHISRPEAESRLADVGIDPTTRPENIDPAQWCALAARLR